MVGFLAPSILGPEKILHSTGLVNPVLEDSDSAEVSQISLVAQDLRSSMSSGAVLALNLRSGWLELLTPPNHLPYY